MTDRPTPEQLATYGGWVCEDFLAALQSHGYVIVHPDDVPMQTNEAGEPGTTQYCVGWNHARATIFGEGTP